MVKAGALSGALASTRRYDLKTQAPTRGQLKKMFPLDVKFSATGVRHERNADGVLVRKTAVVEQERENR